MNPSRLEDAVAIVGYSHRLPGPLRSDADFWHLLSTRDVVRSPVAERFGKGVRPIGSGANFGRFASPYEGLIDDDVRFALDAGFFGLSRTEMEQASPMARMLMNCSWEAIEHSGWSINALRNSPTGVFVGAQTPPESNYRPPHGNNMFSVIGISLAMLANRISYQYNLMGPSITCCTACSAGLSALHTAMNALKAGDCEQALVGSCNSMASARLSTAFNALGVISPHGRCNSFDADADGYMRSEGVFFFAIKPLPAAERDGDRVYAVLEATAVNTAGAADGAHGLASGRFITAPTQHSQAELMRIACARAGREPQDFDYIEAHATGTVVGDRIEGNAIADAFGGCAREVPLRLSSVKSNLGHMEAAAFHCALLKTILMMQERTFAPISKNFNAPNLEIDFERGNMQVLTACEPFAERPAVVGINSFGFGGANGHCVVSEYRPREPRVWSVALAANAGTMIPLSARTPRMLVETARDLQEAIRPHSWDLYTLAGNLSRRRTHFPARTAFAVRSRDHLLEALEAFGQDPGLVATVDEEEQPLVMVFTGQGTQWAGCGRELYAAHPVFRRVVDAVEDHWRTHSETSLRNACFTAPQAALDECELAQPVTFMIQCALLEMFKTWGAHPDCVVGHSSGEVAAAYACGALSLAEATRLVYHRATLQQRTAGSGRMLVVGLDRPGVEDLLRSVRDLPLSDRNGAAPVEIACENSPVSTVVCGSEAELAPIIEQLERRNLQHQLIPGNIAFHSRAMDPIREDVLASLAFLDEREYDADVPMISSVTGGKVDVLDSAYWWGNIRQPVRFGAALESILRDFRSGVILEVAPHSALQGTIAQCLQSSSATSVCQPTLMRDSDPGLDFHRALGHLFEAGISLDFRSQYPRPQPIAHLLPAHPRDESTAMDPFIDDEVLLKQGENSHGPMVGRRVASDSLLFETRLSVNDFPWLAEHRIYGSSIMPATGYAEMVLEALEGVPVHIEDLECLKGCPIPQVAVRLQTHLVPVPHAPDMFTFTISSRTYDKDAVSEIHSRGRVRLMDKEPKLSIPRSLSELNLDRFKFGNLVEGRDFYERVEVVLENTFSYGPSFQTVQRYWQDPNTNDMLVELEMDEEWWSNGRDEGMVVNPTMLDGILQVLLNNLLPHTDMFSMPHRIARLTFFRPQTSPRVTCFIPDQSQIWGEVDEVGQPSLASKQRQAHYLNLGFYDRETGELIAVLGDYYTIAHDSNWNDMARSKHLVSWQPKFLSDAHVPTGPEGIAEDEPAAIIEALQRTGRSERRVIRVVEWAGCREPEETVLRLCEESLAGLGRHMEYWLVTDRPDTAQACFDQFHRWDAALRFEPVAPEDQILSMLEQGPLRPETAELQLLHGEQAPTDRAGWELLYRLAIPGGLAVVRHRPGCVVVPDAGWTTLHVGTHATVLRAIAADGEDFDIVPVPGPRWVLGETGSWAASWAARFNDAHMHHVRSELFEASKFELLDEWPFADELHAIDFFCGRDSNDPTGEGVVARFIALVQALVTRRLGIAANPCRLTVVTQGAVLDVEDPRAQVLWGAVRSMAVEVATDAALDFRLVDLGSQEDLSVLERLARVDLRESELAVREQRLWSPRVVSKDALYTPLQAGEDACYKLTVFNPGQLDGLQMKTYQPAELDDDSVEIQMSAAALNFRDIMVTLNMLPPAAFEQSALGTEIGIEGSGMVCRVGAGVLQHRPGDEVVFTKGGCIADRVVVHQHTVFRKPSCLSLIQGASVLSVYTTSYYALMHLARLRKGQRVLIHSAMGGVGLAAIALAKHVGAEIYATAGNEEKRNKLRALGVREVFDSHSFDWYDGLMDRTCGEGVDVVLNSLSGRHVALCLEALRPGGWHCEIGKVDIFADNALNMFVFRKNLRFAAIDVDRLMLEDPRLTHEISRACLELFEQGLVPPLPVTVFPYHKYAEALRLMMSGQHQGKLVLEAPPRPSESGLSIADRQPYLDPDATYLVTGGLGGIGLHVLSYLVVSGARHLTLMDRDPKRRRSVEWIRQESYLSQIDFDYEIEIVTADVACEEDVRRCITGLSRPLKGVFHLAGVIDDHLLVDMPRESVARVFAPKARGALNLHRATIDCPLDYFVMFSSVASTFGNPAQANYSAASAFLDGLAAWRRRRGLPGLSFNTAAIKEVGMAARNLHVLRMVQSSGLPPVSARFCLYNLDYAMRARPDHDHLITALFRKPPWPQTSPAYMRTGHLVNNADAFRLDAGRQFTVDYVVKQITAKVAELSGHEDISVDDPLSTFGLNSISVAELGAYIQSQFQFQVSALELMTTATCLSLAEAIVTGKSSAAERQVEDEVDNPEEVVRLNRTVVRRPSVFAAEPEDHFPLATPEAVVS
ncbi:MAG: SDR family NAD(P)-dependent oxidoreductase [Caldilineaceae bacterium SB0664_bin_22]|nr:SDR family NAD(P)-dependent oxidoreductase [Caldilineaceae bacterium SB0664_bin_22]MYC62298.1 SDR family NAD(P)-dependent oxidoreductase [Caldilineaceae bacterium SB0661_bin_34]